MLSFDVSELSTDCCVFLVFCVYIVSNSGLCNVIILFVMPGYCSAANCSADSRKMDGRRFFSFPADEERYSSVQIISITDNRSHLL